jgi:large subunit ribosomal protein L24
MPSKVKLPKPAITPKSHVRTGDRVIVLSGSTAGKTGTVVRVFPDDQRALVDGDAAVYETKHIKPNPQAQVTGGRVKRLRPIHTSKLALVDPTTGKAAVRVKHVRDANGFVVRVAKKSGHRFENPAKPPAKA